MRRVLVLGNSLKCIISLSIQYSKYIFDVVGGPNLHYKNNLQILEKHYFSHLFTLISIPQASPQAVLEVLLLIRLKPIA